MAIKHKFSSAIAAKAAQYGDLIHVEEYLFVNSIESSTCSQIKNIAIGMYCILEKFVHVVHILINAGLYL